MKTRLESYSIGELMVIANGISVLVGAAIGELDQDEKLKDGSFSVQKVLEFQGEIMNEVSCRLPEKILNQSALFPQGNILEEEEKNG